MGVGASWTARTYADEKAQEALKAIQMQLRHHEEDTHTGAVRRDEYAKDMDRIYGTLGRLEDKIDKMLAR
jgi:hypothetical protein